MLRHLLAQGIPVGPLGEPREAWRVGNGKLHLARTCQDRAQPVTVKLIDFTYDEVCSRCNTSHNWGTQRWLNWVSDIETQRREAKEMLEGRHRAMGGARGSQGRLHMWLWALANPASEQWRMDHREIAAWEQRVHEPLLRKALAAVDAEVGHPVPQDWPVRAGVIKAIAGTVDDKLVPRAVYPSLWVEAQFRSRTDRSQGEIATFIVNEIRLAVVAGMDPAEAARSAAVEAIARIRTMGSPDTRDQYPLGKPVLDGSYGTLKELLDAAWVAAASDEVTALATNIATRVSTLMDAVNAEPLVAMHWRRPELSFWDTGLPMLLHYAQAADPKHDVQEILVIAPESMKDYIVEETRKARPRFVWGPLQDGDTADTFHTARQMRDSLDDSISDDVVADLARAAQV